MNNVLGYLRQYGGLSFQERPFCEVDGLILSQFAYLKVDGLVPKLKEDTDAVSLRMLFGHPDRERLFADKRFARDNRRLFLLMCRSARFREMKINYYVNIIDEQIGTQFSAMTFFPQGALPFVAFRGTDETLIGWKEDFYMAFTEPIPSQDYCVIYTMQAAKRITGDFFVGGHSKGGNLAVYAAMRCPDEVVERFARIYSFDGPGMRPEMLKDDENGRGNRVRRLIYKVVPRASVVGMMLQQQTRYLVVKSNAFGLLQHDPYTWMIENGRFVCSNGLSRRQRLMDKALNTWIFSLSEGQLRHFIENLFRVWYDFLGGGLLKPDDGSGRRLRRLADACRDLDAVERRFMFRLAGRFITIFFAVQSRLIFRRGGRCKPKQKVKRDGRIDL